MKSKTLLNIGYPTDSGKAVYKSPQSILSVMGQRENRTPRAQVLVGTVIRC